MLFLVITFLIPSSTVMARTRIVLQLASTMGESWIHVRLSELVEHRLTWLGYRVISDVRRASSSSLGQLVQLRIGPPSRALEHDGKFPITIRVGSHHTTPIYGRPEELEKAALDVSLRIYKLLGCMANRSLDSMFRGLHLPWSLHRLAGQAGLRRAKSQLRQARILFGRVAEGRKGHTPVRELLTTRTLRLETDGPSPELVSAALERVDDAKLHHRFAEANDAALDAVRFGISPRLHWQRDLAVRARQVWPTSDSVWVDEGRKKLQLDQRNGHLRSSLVHQGAIVGIHNKDLLLTDGPFLIRYTTDRHHRRRWRHRRPLGLRRHVYLSGAGQILLTGSKGIGWMESSRGKVGKILWKSKLLAVNASGALVETTQTSSTVFGLLRPGRNTMAWQHTLSSRATDARMTDSRALVLVKNKLRIYDLHNGRLVEPILSFPFAVRILGVEGRHAVLQSSRHGVTVVDIYDRVITAQVKGPGTPVSSLSLPYEITVIYHTGDVLRWDPDGLLLDRARLEAGPRQIHPATPGIPRVLIETDNGLYAFSSFQPEARTDIDMLLIAAAAALKRGELESAFVLATEVASMDVGNISQAEDLRIQAMERMNPQQFAISLDEARVRRQAALIPTQPLTKFALKRCRQ